MVVIITSSSLWGKCSTLGRKHARRSAVAGREYLCLVLRIAGSERPVKAWRELGGSGIPE
jgi:hypothetical protein